MQSSTRHQLKEDKFAKGAGEAAHWAIEHRPVLLWLIGGAAIIAVAVLGLAAWNSHESEQANVALGHALEALNAPLRPAGTPATPDQVSFTSNLERAKEAERQLKAIASQFPYAKAGKFAGYLAGTAAIQAGDNSEAEQQLKSAADSSDKNIAALAKLALANLDRTTNRSSDAAKLYKDLSDHPTDTVSKGEAQLQLAEMYEATDPKEAATIYQQIQKEAPTSAAGRIAQSKLAKASK